MKDIVYLGSELKLNIYIEPINGRTMDQYNFECEFYCHPNKRVKKVKQEMQGTDAGYIAVIDSKELGIGNLTCKVTAYLPDTYGGSDGVRAEVSLVDLDICIKYA